MNTTKALELLQEDKEERKLVYGIKISRGSEKVRLDILIDKTIAAKYRAYLIMLLGVKPCEATFAMDDWAADWNLPLEFVQEKYDDVVKFTFKFKED